MKFLKDMLTNALVVHFYGCILKYLFEMKSLKKS